MSLSQLIYDCDLPKDCDKEGWAKLEEWGVVRMGEADDLFFAVSLPEGWSKQSTNNSLYSNLVDGDGLIRASIFYKSSFYDRKALMGVNVNRYQVARGIGDEHQYDVVDSGSDRKIVRSFPASHWGYAMIKGIKLVGCIHSDGLFYYFAKGDFLKASFCKSCDADFATQISSDTFYKEFHHKTEGGLHKEIRAIEHLASQDARALAEKLNKESGW